MDESRAREKAREVILKAICHEHRQIGATCTPDLHCYKCEQVTINLSADFKNELLSAYQQGSVDKELKPIDDALESTKERE